MCVRVKLLLLSLLDAFCPPQCLCERYYGNFGGQFQCASDPSHEVVLEVHKWAGWIIGGAFDNIQAQKPLHSPPGHPLLFTIAAMTQSLTCHKAKTSSPTQMVIFHT